MDPSALGPLGLGPLGLGHPRLTYTGAALGGVFAVLAVAFVVVRLWLRVVTFVVLALLAGVVALLASLSHATGHLHLPHG